MQSKTVFILKFESRSDIKFLKLQFYSIYTRTDERFSINHKHNNLYMDVVIDLVVKVMKQKKMKKETYHDRGHKIYLEMGN